jgi:TATA-box binding protein (TBP) (component of TFIID and TFIIIB)
MGKGKEIINIKDNNYYRNIQKKHIDDSKNFVKYLSSKEYFDCIDIENIEPYEGDASKKDFMINQLHTFNKVIDSLFINNIDSSSSSSNEKKNEKERFLDSFVEFSKNQSLLHNKNEKKESTVNEEEDEESTKREIITFKGKDGARLDVSIENFVFVTYYANKYELGKSHNLKFNLLGMCEETLDLGVHYSKHKFSKNNYRFIDKNGIVIGSHLLFRSQVCVETGFKRKKDAKKMARHRLKILRERCGYPNIIIIKRQCQNVVATGTFNFSVCLNLLKARFPTIIYNKETFAGAVIKMKSLQYNKYNDINNNDNDIYYEDEEDESNDETGIDDNEEENREYIAKWKKNKKKQIKQQLFNNIDNNENNPCYDNEDDEDDDNDQEDDSNNEDEEDDDSSSSSSSIDIEDDSIDENVVDISKIIEKNNNRKPQVTVLVFLKGQIIIVGNKSRRGVIKSTRIIYPMLESCRNTPENLAVENELINSQKRGPKKRKAADIKKEPINKKVKRV